MNFKRLLICMPIVVLLAGTAWGWMYLHRPSTDPITHVQVVGNFVHVDREKIINASIGYVRRGFFAVDTKSLQAALRTIPWVDDVAVTRVWPDTILLEVTEKQAVARWRLHELLTADGHAFTPEPKHYIDSLPLLVGPVGQEQIVKNYFDKITAILSPCKLKVSEIHLTERGSLWLRLDNNVVLMLGRADPLNRLQHFTQSYQSVFGDHLNDAERVDLRYPSGIAVKWRHNLQTQGA